MTREECSKAHRLAGRLLARLPAGSDEHEMALKLRGMLAPLPTPADILQRVLPHASVKAKSDVLGISRQYFYLIQNGSSRPGPETMQRIAKLAGVPEDVLKEVW